VEQNDLLRKIVEVCEQLKLPHFVTGSIAATFYGEPRFTNDIDVVVDLRADQVHVFCEMFPAGEFYVSEDTARTAVISHGQFNIIHPESGLKIDVIIPADDAFNKSRFLRRRRVEAEPGLVATLATPEDVILKKLQYYKEGLSNKHLRDIAGIMKITRDAVDFDYLEKWVEVLDLKQEWQQAKIESGL
jgi:hypothetical protein